MFNRLQTYGLPAILGAILCILACEGTLDDNASGGQSLSYVFTFATNSEEWREGFADYPPGRTMDNFYELSFAYSQLPLYLGNNISGLFLSGNNHNNDLFMYVKRELDGLKPNTDYAAVFHIELAATTPEIGDGDGGDTGSGSYLKAGATLTEPLSLITNDYYTMNIDKGNHASGGKDSISLGNIASGTSLDPLYKLKVFENGTPVSLKTDEAGSVWIHVGTDSVLGGITSVYFSSITVTFSERQP